MNVPIIWVMGAPGSGKSTLAQTIVNKYGYKLLDPMALVEREIEVKSSRGLAFAEKRKRGEKVAMMDLVLLLEGEILINRTARKGFVLDGYPQNQNDATLLEERIGAPDLIIALQVAQETAETRKSRDGTALTSSISFYVKNAGPVLAQYANKTLQINGERDMSDIINDIVPNMEILAKNYGNNIEIQR